MEKWNIGWGPISACNMVCEFCYSKNTRIEMDDLGLDDWIKFIDQNHAKIGSINYGTGENTLDRDWFMLIDYIRRNYPTITQALTTNGHLIEMISKDEELHRIARLAIDEIDVSLDFADPDRHNKFRGQSSAFDWVIDTLDFCKTYGIEATIVFLGCNETLEINNLEGLFEIAKANDAKVRMNIYRPTNGIDKLSETFIADYDKIIEAVQWIDKTHSVLALSDPLFNSILCEGEIEEDPSGLSSLRILSDGSITPSTYLITDNFRKFTIKDQDVLARIEEEGIFEGFEVKTPDACKGCEYVETCNGGVYDRRFLWYKTFDTHDPYCPIHNDYIIPEKKISIDKSQKLESVHYGYLPTLFFGSK